MSVDDVDSVSPAPAPKRDDKKRPSKPGRRQPGPDDLPGHLGPYPVSERLGSGGMGEVYGAHDPVLDRQVAIKLVRRSRSEGNKVRAWRRRFRREAQVSARLNHPNIVQVFHTIDTELGDAIVMERVFGRSLASILRRGALSPWMTAEWGRQIAEGLAAAHDQGIIHRDLKAANVMVSDEGMVKVLDFGLAKDQLENPRGSYEEVLTEVGQVVGSYDSMSPEQARGYEVGARSDLFSLGVLLFRMATGTKPFEGGSLAATVTKICAEPHPDPASIVPGLAQDLVELIDQLLAKRAEQRPGDAHRVAVRLRAIAAGMTDSSSDAGPLTSKAMEVEGLSSAMDSETPILRAMVVVGATSETRAAAVSPFSDPDRTALLANRFSGLLIGNPEGRGDRPGTQDDCRRVVFEHTRNALEFALAFVLEEGESGWSDQEAPAPRFQGAAAVHFAPWSSAGSKGGETDHRPSAKPSGPSSRITVSQADRGNDPASLVKEVWAMARPGQILVTGSAFEQARGLLLGQAMPAATGSQARAGDPRAGDSRSADSSVDQSSESGSAEPSTTDAALCWLAHGEYLLGTQVLELFELGRLGRSAMRPPEGAKPDGNERVLGRRPAVGMEAPGRRRWRLETQLGEGHLGEVWLARHVHTGERRVLKYCFHASRLAPLRREIHLFQRLREHLGDTVGIARVLDWSFDRPPYFIESEYTEGGDLEVWCRARGGVAEVPLVTRLDIVAQVAEALAAAHSVGVLHRNVSPANILISADGQGRPKVRLADFGIGGLTEELRLRHDSSTDVGAQEPLPDLEPPAGRRLYLAPELLLGGRGTVSSDLYAVGVLLYQMVIGDLGRALGVGWRQQVAEPLLAADIAVLVDGSPQRRPESASWIAHQLRRLPSRRERVRVEIEDREQAQQLRLHALAAGRRRRWWTLALAALMLLGSLTAAQTLRLATERQRANREAATARAASEFMVDLFARSDPWNPQVPGQAATLEEILDRGGAYLDEGLEELDDSDQAAVATKARLASTLGVIYQGLGLYRSAEHRLRQSTRWMAKQPESDPRRRARGLLKLAAAQRSLGRLKAAETGAQEALDLANGGGGAPVEVDPLPAEALGLLAGLWIAQDQVNEGLRAARQSVDIYRRLPVTGHTRDLGAALSRLAWALDRAGQTEQATTTAEQAHELLQRVTAGRDPVFQVNGFHLARLYQRNGSLAEAEQLYDQLEQRLLAGFDPHHPTLALVAGGRGELSLLAGELSAAESRFRFAQERLAAGLGSASPLLRAPFYGLARVCRLRGDSEQAMIFYRQAVALPDRSVAGPPLDSEVLLRLSQLGVEGGVEALEEEMAAWVEGEARVPARATQSSTQGGGAS